MKHVHLTVSAAADPVVMPAAPVENTARVISVMRLAGPAMGLSAQVLRTLELLLSCLPPKRNHHTVFASNDTLSLRAGGISDRSLRRHIAQLWEAGLLIRSDSPNRKRFTRLDPVAGQMMRFGLDLSPLFSRFADLAALAEAEEKVIRQLRYLRLKLRTAAQRLLQAVPGHPEAEEALKAVRRKLSADELQILLAQFPQVSESPSDAPCPTRATPGMAVNAGQNDRHHHNLNKEHLDKKATNPIATLLAACPEALEYAVKPLQSEQDIITHARLLAPMLNIPHQLVDEANEKKDAFSVAALIWVIVQRGCQIVSPQAYFRSLTTGKKQESFSPWNYISRLTSQLSHPIT